MFLSNGGGSTEQTKADGMNKLIGLSGQGRITENEVVLCHTILKSKHFQDRFRDKWILVDGFSRDESALAMSYGFKKVISVKELQSLTPHINAHSILDFWMSKEAMQKTQQAVCKRYGMTAE